jgi:hypothetical protein
LSLLQKSQIPSFPRTDMTQWVTRSMKAPLTVRPERSKPCLRHGKVCSLKNICLEALRGKKQFPTSRFCCHKKLFLERYRRANTGATGLRNLSPNGGGTFIQRQRRESRVLRNLPISWIPGFAHWRQLKPRLLTGLVPTLLRGNARRDFPASRARRSPMRNDSDRQIGRRSIPVWVPAQERGNQNTRTPEHQNSTRTQPELNQNSTRAERVSGA